MRRGDGRPPAIILIDPKFPHNVGAAVRAASCYGVGQVWFSGDRVSLIGERRFRLGRGFDEPDHLADAVGVT